MHPERIPARTEAQCRTMFSDFYNNPVIQELGKEQAWTISDSAKMPVSMQGLLNYSECKGASIYVPDDMVTLDELVHFYPDAVNNAFFLRDQGKYAILDIEPTATNKCKRIMLATPWHYAEVSMSGKGIHLIIDYPEELIRKYPNSHKTTAKHNSGTYELHMQHWITFTRRTIAKDETWGTISLEEALTPLMSQQKAPIVAPIRHLVTLERDTNGKTPSIVECLKGFPEWWNTALGNTPTIYARKKPQTTEDRSRWDFSCALHIAHCIIRAAENTNNDIPDFDELFQITYKTLCYVFVNLDLWRDKNDAMRGGMTYLEMTCQRAVDLALADHEDTSGDVEIEPKK